jgi:chromosome segregation ATPase
MTLKTDNKTLDMFEEYLEDIAAEEINLKSRAMVRNARLRKLKATRTVLTRRGKSKTKRFEELCKDIRELQFATQRANSELARFQKRHRLDLGIDNARPSWNWN